MDSAGLKRIIILPVLVLAAAWLLQLTSREKEHDFTEEKGERGPVVAIVEGQSIFLDDVKPDREMLDRIHPNLTAEEKSEAVFRYKMANLIRLVRDIILERKIEELGLPTYDEELDRYAAEMLEKTFMTEESAMKAISDMHTIAAALEEWLKNPSMSDSIYDEKLAPIDISETAWESYKRQLDTPEKIKRMLSVLPEAFEDIIIQIRPVFEQEFLDKKLKEFIGADVSVSKKEVEEDYHAMYGHLPESERPGFDEVERKLYRELRAWKQKEAFKEWRRDQFLKADIQLMDERFENIMQFLF